MKPELFEFHRILCVWHAENPQVERQAKGSGWTMPADIVQAVPKDMNKSKHSIWRSTWWPVGQVAELSEEQPNTTQLLGMDLVLWKDARGQWCAARDECPHRWNVPRVNKVWHTAEFDQLHYVPGVLASGIDGNGLIVMTAPAAAHYVDTQG
jgi:Rieske [2Fe-2S] domain